MSNDITKSAGRVRKLRGSDVEIGSEVDRAYVIDHARNEEGLLDDQALVSKWGLSNQQVTDLASDTDLHLLIQAERARRVRSGIAVTEKAQHLLVKGPQVLDDIAAGDMSSDANKIAAIAAQAKLAQRDGLKSGAAVGGGERVNFSVITGRNADGTDTGLFITIPAPPGSTPEDFGTTIEHQPPDDGDKS